MATETTPALTLTALVTRALSNASDSGRSKVDMNGLSVEFIDAAVGGLCLLVSGEGQAHKAEIKTIAGHWSSLYGSAVEVKTDAHEDYEGGEFTCLWLSMDAAIENLAA